MAIGDEWSMKVSLPPVSFGVGRPVRAEMVDAVNLALDKDVKYEIPKNYLRGEGDSEFLNVCSPCTVSAGDLPVHLGFRNAGLECAGTECTLLVDAEARRMQRGMSWCV